MTILSRGITAFFDLLERPLGEAHPYYHMTVVSVVTGVVMVLIFKYTTNQAAMKEAKEKLKAHFIEILLYRDDLRVLFATQRSLLYQNFRYMRFSLWPALPIMLVPLAFIVIQLELRYGHRPLVPGESATVTLRMESVAEAADVSLEIPPGVELETPVLRIWDKADTRALWRVSALEEGRFPLIARLADQELTKEMVVGSLPAKAVPETGKDSVWEAFTRAGQRPLPAGSPARSFEISYPPYEFPLGPLRLHWVWIWGGISLAFAFALKPVLNVE